MIGDGADVRDRLPVPAIFVGTAGWSIPRASAGGFAGEGTHLQRYGRRLACAEINSSFYRPHARTTYARWAESVPPWFRFSVKLPKTITHEHKLCGADALLTRFVDECTGLGPRLGPLLVQLPPSLAFDAAIVAPFFARLRQLHGGAVVCEPRHPSWFTRAAEAVMTDHRVARVAADPAVAVGADRPGGWLGQTYFRWHGSPRTYWSRYLEPTIEMLATALCAATRTGEAWCIFDNTASGAALENAMELTQSCGRLCGRGAQPSIHASRSPSSCG